MLLSKFRTTVQRAEAGVLRIVSGAFCTIGDGLLVYDYTAKKFKFYNGTAWKTFTLDP